jgi:hypothetical protein
VYDTRNDDDTYHLEVTWQTGDAYHVLGPYTVSGTSAVVDYDTFNLDIPEGATVHVYVYDDAGLTDSMGGGIGTA